MSSVETFAAEAAAFERWLLDGADRDVDAVRAALVRVVSLYRAAIDLPPEWSDELRNTPDVERANDAARIAAAVAAHKLPLDLYGEVFNPTLVPPEQPVIGSLADDLADIYRDVVSGLRVYEKGNRASAVWEWGFNLHAHWGAHATSAIRALHWWLVENAIDRLSVGPE